jgi:hypothetical protein
LPAEAQITPLASCSGAQVRHLVVGAAQLEAEHRLLVFALEQHARVVDGNVSRAS